MDTIKTKEFWEQVLTDFTVNNTDCYWFICNASKTFRSQWNKNNQSDQLKLLADEFLINNIDKNPQYLKYKRHYPDNLFETSTEIRIEFINYMISITQ